MGNYFVGALGYADDIILLCPSVVGLNKMIRICEEYAEKHHILFNGKKSKYLIFGTYKYNHTVRVNDEIVERCDSAMYLGHKLHTKNTQDVLIDHAIEKLNGSFHGFMSRFRSCNVTCKNKLFHQYCSSMYGSQLWQMSNAERVYSKWRKYHRIILNVVNTTHCDLLPLIADNMPLECSLDLKYMSFYKSIISSENSIIKYTDQSMSHSHTSILCKNLTYLTYKYQLSIGDIMTSSKSKLKKHCYSNWLLGIENIYPTHANVICDMIAMIEDRCTRIFSNDECKHIIDFLCTI